MFKPKIILVDDHNIFRQGLKSLLTVEGIADVIAEAGNGKVLLELLETLEPDMVITDISMPEMDGIEAVKKAIEKNPDLKILAITSFGEEEYYHKMIDAGAKGFILKNSDISELEIAIKRICDGDSYFSNEILRKIIFNAGKSTQGIAKALLDLTKREVEVIQLICQGLTSDEIAEKLFLSPETIKGHRSKIFSKTGCKNTAALVMFAIKNKIVEIEI